MPLDPQAQALLQQMAAAGGPPLEQMTVQQARELSVAMKDLGGPPEPLPKVEDRMIPGPAGEIPVRIYTPEGTGPFPVLVYFHGGGWVIGSIETHDAAVRALAKAAGCIAVSVDYRLAPEHKFPTAAEDGYAATRWVAENAASFGGDPARIAVAGDSAGGNLSAVVALMARDRRGPHLVYQALIYPVTDHSYETASYRENAEGYLLTKSSMVWFWDHYLNNEADGRNPYASPLQATDLHSLPPALVVTAEFDPLRDEGEAYARRLHEAGVPVIQRRYDGLIHGSFQMAGVLEQGARMLHETATALRTAFAVSEGIVPA
ncbi:MAG: alpha/beta hydrolase [Dehalococcoidia bacterium]